MQSLIFGDDNPESVFGQFNKALASGFELLDLPSQTFNLNKANSGIEFFNRHLESNSDLRVNIALGNNELAGWNLLAARKYPSTLLIHDLFLWDAFDELIHASVLFKIPNQWFYTENKIISSKQCSTWLEETGWPINSRTVNAVELLTRLIILGKDVVTHSIWARERIEALTRNIPRDFHLTGSVHNLQLPTFKPTFSSSASTSNLHDNAHSIPDSHNGPIVTILGHLDLNRGILEALQAQKILNQEGVILALGGPMSKEVQVLLKEYQDFGVHYLGHLSTEQYLGALAKSDMFLNFRKFPTEAGSGTLIDYLETGKPILVNTVGCRRDFFGYKGLHSIDQISVTEIVNFVRRAGLNTLNPNGKKYESLALDEYGLKLAEISHKNMSMELRNNHMRNSTILSTSFGF